MGTFTCTPHVPIFPLFIHIFISCFQPPPPSIHAIPGSLPVATHSNLSPRLPSSIHPPLPPPPNTAHLCEIQCDRSCGLCPAWHSLHICADRPSLLGQSERQDDRQADVCVQNPADLRKSPRATDPSGIPSFLKTFSTSPSLTM